MVEILLCATEEDASVTQHLDERAEIAVPWLSVRPAPMMAALFWR